MYVSYVGIIQKQYGGRKQDDFPYWQNSKDFCGIFDDEDNNWVQIGNQGDKSNSIHET